MIIVIVFVEEINKDILVYNQFWPYFRITLRMIFASKINLVMRKGNIEV